MKKRICRRCHKPHGKNQKLCDTCERVEELHRAEVARQESRKMIAWFKRPMAG